MAVGIYSFKRKDPMNFWTFSNVPAEKVSDIPGYNRANGKMWFVAAIVIAANIPFANADPTLFGIVSKKKFLARFKNPANLPI